MCVFVMSSEARTNKRYDERRQVTRKKGKKHKESGPWDNKMKNVTQTRTKKKKNTTTTTTARTGLTSEFVARVLRNANTRETGKKDEVGRKRKHKQRESKRLPPPSSPSLH